MFTSRLTPSVAVFLPALALVAGSVRAQAPATSSPGWTYTTNITIDSGDAGRRVSMAMRYQITTRYLRMGWLQVSGAAENLGSVEGMYTVLDGVDSTITSVMPNQRMASVMALGPILGAQSQRMRIGEPHITKNDIQDLGPGDRILGHATRHYRATVAGTMQVTFGAGETCTKQLDAVTEMWMAPDVDLRPAMQAAAAHYGVAANLDQLANPVPGSPAAMPTGTGLRIITTTTEPDGNGKHVTVTSRIDIVDFAQGPVSNSLFAVPSDYKTMDMRTMMAKAPQGMLDSAIRVGTAAGNAAAAKAMCGAGKAP